MQFNRLIQILRRKTIPYSSGVDGLCGFADSLLAPALLTGISASSSSNSATAQARSILRNKDLARTTSGGQDEFPKTHQEIDVSRISVTCGLLGIAKSLQFPLNCFSIARWPSSRQVTVIFVGQIGPFVSSERQQNLSELERSKQKHSLSAVDQFV